MSDDHGANIKLQILTILNNSLCDIIKTCKSKNIIYSQWFFFNKHEKEIRELVDSLFWEQTSNLNALTSLRPTDDTSEHEYMCMH